MLSGSRPMSSQYQKFVDENQNVIHTQKQVHDKEKERIQQMRASQSLTVS